jgi:hypothetical protein
LKIEGAGKATSNAKGWRRKRKKPRSPNLRLERKSFEKSKGHPNGWPFLFFAQINQFFKTQTSSPRGIWVKNPVNNFPFKSKERTDFIG